MENSCCIEKKYNAIDYFMKKNNTIEKNNESVEYLQNMINNYYAISQSSSFYSTKITSRKFPELSNQFSENTIYQGFIHFCKFNTILPIPENLLSFCISKPQNFKEFDSLQEKIKLLKEQGKKYTLESFHQLLKVVESENKITINFDEKYLSEFQKLHVFLDAKQRELASINTEIDSEFFIDNTLIKLLMKFADQNDLYYSEQPVILKDFINDITRKNTQLQTSLIEFLQTNSTISKRKFSRITDFINNILTWNDVDLNNTELSIDNDILFHNASDYLKDIIKLTISVFPNIIINIIDYNDQAIPSHWKLSGLHSSDISAIIEKYYEKLTKFYNDEQLDDLLKKFTYYTKDMIKLIDLIPSFNTTYNGNKKSYSLFNTKVNALMMKHIMLTVFNLFIKSIILPFEEGIEEKKIGEKFEPIVSNLVIDEEIGNIEEIDIVSGKISKMNATITDLIIAMINIFIGSKNIIDYTHENVLEKVNISKEKEKDMVTQRLKELSDEEREIENVLKNHKLGQWNKGLLKGLVQYQPGTYDEEREVIEKQMDIEQQLGNNDNVTAMNREIYALDIIEKEQVVEQIEREEADLSMYFGENEDPAEVGMDGDENY